MSEGMSCFFNCTKRYNVKSIFVIALLLVIISGNLYLYEYRQLRPTPSERCSSKYPQTSVILDLWVTLPDGSMQATGGVTYPLKATWTSDGIVRGCPCSIAPCIQSCCPEGMDLPDDLESFNTNGFGSLFKSPKEPVIGNFNASFIMNDTNEFIIGDDQQEAILNGESKIEPLHDSIVNVKTQCIHTQENETDTNLRRLVKPLMNQSKSNQFTIFGPQCRFIYSYGNAKPKLLADGKLWMNEFLHYVEITETCFDLRNFNVYTCVNWNSLSVKSETEDTILQNFWHKIFIVLAIIIHIITVIVFILVPHLRKGYGSPVLCYVLSQLLRKVVIILHDFIEPIQTYLNINISKVLISLEYFTDLSSQFWQVAIAHQIWTAFRPGKVFLPNNSMLRFKIYCMLAWGIPAVLTAISGMWTEETILAEVGYQLRDFGSLLPGLTAEVVCMVLCAATVWGVRSWREGGSKLKGADSQRHNAKDVHWSLIFLKVTMMTGVDYILATTLLMVEQGYFWRHSVFKVSPSIFKVPSDINNLRGMEVFLIFVLKVDVWKVMLARFQLGGKSSSSSQFLPKKTIATTQVAKKCLNNIVKNIVTLYIQY